MINEKAVARMRMMIVRLEKVEKFQAERKVTSDGRVYLFRKAERGMTRGSTAYINK